MGDTTEAGVLLARAAGFRPYQLFRHFKGGLYVGLCLAAHSETSVRLVVYRSVKLGRTWARPAESFFEDVQLPGGRTVRRFMPVTDASTQPQDGPDEH